VSGFDKSTGQAIRLDHDSILHMLRVVQIGGYFYLLMW
jgi:hypothetical protein